MISQYFTRRIVPLLLATQPHAELEDTTKTALMQTIAKAAKQAAIKEPIDVSNSMQLANICLAAARLFGWKGESPVSVAVNADKAAVVVCTEEQRQRIIALREKLLAETVSPAAMTLPNPQTQLKANCDAENIIGEADCKPPQPDPYLREMQSSGNAESWKQGKGSEPTFSAPAGAKAPGDASPVFRAWLEHEGPEPEPGPEYEI